MSRILRAVAVLVGLGLATGCTGSNPVQSAAEDHKAALAELGEMLKSLAEERRKPPGKLAELESVEPMIPLAGPAIRSGNIVYIWGAGYAAGGNQVVAYEKKVPSEGGYVLLQDGTVKEMSSAEFSSAPKAK
jgi:hypothetical protein